ncbi:SufD family Fe-S cluster assembly protein [Candidatus Gracilibacteria bacterium]|nr:SufD family Fe-S cluster assembly protein [Candidatus Gracilibacteria bacterium]
MTVSIIGSKSEASLELLALARDNSVLEIDGIGKVAPGCENVKLRVDQTNILLGEGARVRGRPVLEIETDSIEGGHSCKIQQVSKEKLFYLESHGIDADTAEGMLLEGEIAHHLRIVDKWNDGMKEDILLKIFHKNPA